MWTKGRDILKVEPNVAAPANGISTCIKGKFGWDFINSPERLTTPLIREGDRFRAASWPEAIGTIARRFSAIRAAHGPDSIGLIASSKCTNEEAYLVQKLARAVVGTNNVDNCSRYCQAPATTGLFRTVGYGGDSGSITDIGQADLVLIVGSNTAESHPVIATRIKRAHKLRGQKLVVVDLREHEMAERADLFLRPHPGTDMVWLSAITKYILDNGLADQEFLDARVTRAGRVPCQPRAVHARIRRAGDDDPGERTGTARPDDRGVDGRLRALGDGRHAAHRRLRHEHGDLQPAARHRQLRPPRHRRLPDARPQ